MYQDNAFRHQTGPEEAQPVPDRFIQIRVKRDKSIVVRLKGGGEKAFVNDGLRQAFLNGVDADNDGRIDVPGVSDIRLIIQAYSRQGN